MNKKKILVIMLAIFILSTSVAFAAAVNGEFNEYPVVKVNVNDEAVASDVPGVAMQGRTLLPVRAVAESLNAIVSWDQKTMTANIIKPNAYITFVSDVIENKDGSWNLESPYSYLDAGNYESLLIYYDAIVKVDTKW